MVQDATFLNPHWPAVLSCSLLIRLQISGDTVWTAADGFSGATPLSQWAVGGEHQLVNTMTNQPISGWMPLSVTYRARLVKFPR